MFIDIYGTLDSNRNSPKTDNHKTFIKQSNMAFFYQTNHCDFQINKAIKLEETETTRCDKSWITQRMEFLDSTKT